VAEGERSEIKNGAVQLPQTVESACDFDHNPEARVVAMRSSLRKFIAISGLKHP
jgi:hypothetical protein